MSPFQKMNEALYMKVCGSGMIVDMKKRRRRSIYSRAAHVPHTSGHDAGQEEDGRFQVLCDERKTLSRTKRKEAGSADKLQTAKSLIPNSF
jgi:hypothetical protein